MKPGLRGIAEINIMQVQRNPLGEFFRHFHQNLSDTRGFYDVCVLNEPAALDKPRHVGLHNLSAGNSCTYQGLRHLDVSVCMCLLVCVQLRNTMCVGVCSMSVSSADRALTKVCIRQDWAVGVAAIVEVFVGAAVHSAGFGNGLDQVLIISIPPAPPADLWLAASGNHSPCAQVPITVK